MGEVAAKPTERGKLMEQNALSPAFDECVFLFWDQSSEKYTFVIFVLLSV